MMGLTATLPKLEKPKPTLHWARLPLFNRKNGPRFPFGEG